MPGTGKNAEEWSSKDKFGVVRVNSPEFASQPPSQIVPTLVDRGEYIASESTIYRIMKAAEQQHHRGRARKPSTRW